MDATTVVIIAAVVFAWGTISARLGRAHLTAPIVFMAVGVLAANLGHVDQPALAEDIKPLVTTTLVWVLFADAARVRMRDFRHDLAVYVRLLAIGLPLTMLSGWAVAYWLLPALGVWLALLVAAALAPTDAALGVPVVTDPAVPSRIRRLISVESGLNDGIATPVVMLAIAGAISAERLGEAANLWHAAVELAVGAAVGVVVGVAGGWLLRWGLRRGWAAADFAGVAVLALALLAYGSAHLLHGNGFVAAFCAGLAFGAAVGRLGPAEMGFLEQASGLVSLLVWLAFGAVAVPIAFDHLTPAVLAYAVLSLTLLRMVPVALSLIGAGLDRRTVLFVGWFGPRGLASLVFALLAIEEIGPAAEEAVSVIAVTVFLSVLVHGASAQPLATRYGRAMASQGPQPGGPVPEVPVRGLPGARAHHPAPAGGRESPRSREQKAG
ncbi:MAG TPA: cation:proton antiporter [Pilimelia sp.]|nr:cation:proton antiporter [Pilimelia sp.]